MPNELNALLQLLTAQPIPYSVLLPVSTVPPLQECGEELVPISEPLPFVRCAPEYHRQGVTHAPETCYVRQSVLKRLEQAGQQLGTIGRSLILWDAWRPVGVQQALYDAYQARLRQTFPTLSPQELNERTLEFVALPSRDPHRPSPHLTGGAIDVTLADAKGRLLPMGTDYDDFSPVAATRYFEAVEAERPLTPDEQTCRNNRRVLYHVMADVGFTNYEAEWWHFDYGNRLWARQTGLPPIYGAVEPTF